MYLTRKTNYRQLFVSILQPFKIGSRVSKTSDGQGNVKISKRTMRKRQTETLEQSLKIHGGKAKNHLHEFVHLIWLRERGYGGEDISKSKQTYIPLKVTNGQACFCGFDKGPEEEKCCYCSHNFRAQIEKVFD